MSSEISGHQISELPVDAQLFGDGKRNIWLCPLTLAKILTTSILFKQTVNNDASRIHSVYFNFCSLFIAYL